MCALVEFCAKTGHWVCLLCPWGLSVVCVLRKGWTQLYRAAQVHPGSGPRSLDFLHPLFVTRFVILVQGVKPTRGMHFAGEAASRMSLDLQFLRSGAFTAVRGTEMVAGRG